MTIRPDVLAAVVAPLPATHPAVHTALASLQTCELGPAPLVSALLGGPFAHEPVPDALLDAVLKMGNGRAAGQALEELMSRPGTVCTKLAASALAHHTTRAAAFADDRIPTKAK